MGAEGAELPGHRRADLVHRSASRHGPQHAGRAAGRELAAATVPARRVDPGTGRGAERARPRPALHAGMVASHHGPQRGRPTRAAPGPAASGPPVASVPRALAGRPAASVPPPRPDPLGGAATSPEESWFSGPQLRGLLFWLTLITVTSMWVMLLPGGMALFLLSGRVVQADSAPPAVSPSQLISPASSSGDTLRLAREVGQKPAAGTIVYRQEPLRRRGRRGHRPERPRRVPPGRRRPRRGARPAIPPSNSPPPSATATNGPGRTPGWLGSRGPAARPRRPTTTGTACSGSSRAWRSQKPTSSAIGWPSSPPPSHDDQRFVERFVERTAACWSVQRVQGAWRRVRV